VIASLRGVVLERSGLASPLGGVVIEVGGVGYEVTVTPRLLAELEPKSEVLLHVHHQVREDAQVLFGFADRDERSTFQVLLATHGVGPALAMAIMATHRPAALVDIVAANDLGALTLVPGVGRKTAERLLVELRGKLTMPELAVQSSVGGSIAAAEVREALAGLGYGTEEIRDALGSVMGEGAAERDAPSLLRDALKVLGARRA
jgi:Holliday junction DNA helicase RuvA